MKDGLTHDAKGFVAGIVEYLQNDGQKKTMMPKMQTLLGKVSAQARKERIAHVESAIALTESEKNSLNEVLSHIVGHELTLECAVNTSLIAGLYIQIADFIIDTSYRSKLSSMAAILMR